MKLTKEELLKAGLSEEQADGVLSGFKEMIDGNYIPRATFDAEREKVKAAETLVKERDTQLTELGKFKGTAEELQAKVKTLEEENVAAKTKYDADLLKLQLENAIKQTLTGVVIDADDVLPRLDTSKVVFKEGKILSGLDEQISALKQAKPHYFVSEDPTSKAFPASWLIGGKTPAEGADEGTKTPQQLAEEFGASLAQSRSDSSSIAARAAEHYFK